MKLYLITMLLVCTFAYWHSHACDAAIFVDCGLSIGRALAWTIVILWAHCLGFATWLALQTLRGNR